MSNAKDSKQTDSPSGTLYIIDGYAQFFRAYHAIRSPMSSPVTKEPTNMTFGFTGMLLKLLRGEGSMGGPPEYVAVAIDVSGDRETFRSEIYPEYKANRQETPEDFRPQADRCMRMLEAVGVPILGAEGFEADDVIASLVRRLKKDAPGLRIRIVSKDKDLKQLLEPERVELFDVHTDQRIGADTLKEETGLKPDQVVDMLTLMGDTVDNVPGVAGIGPKTAAKLIAEHGSLDALLEQADTIKGKRGENIRAARDTMALSRRLVTLRDDVDVHLNLADAAPERFDLPALMPILKELGFNRYQEELKALASARGRPLGDADAGQDTRGNTPSPRQARESVGLFDHLDDDQPETVTAPAEGDYRCVRTRGELQTLLKTIKGAGTLAVDTETTSVRPMQAVLCGVSVAVDPGVAWYIPTCSPEPDSHLDEAAVLEALGPLLEDERIAKVGHNIKYDLLVLRRHGVELRGLGRAGSGDPMVASYLIDSARSSHRLDALALALLNRTNLSITDLIGTGKHQKRFDEVPLDLAAPYAAEDADVALQLAQRFEQQLEKLGMLELYHDLELPLIEVLAELEWNGILVDPDELDRQRERLRTRIDDLRQRIRDAAEEETGRAFDPDSPKQLAGILFNKPDTAEPGLGLRPQRRTKTGYSTDAEVLDKLATDPTIGTPIPSLVLEYRQLTKLVNTYLEALKSEIHAETGRIHASFNQTVAATGRLSSSDPNLQNIPIRTDIGREIRRAFIAPPGHVLITADYSQIELRILAHLSKDPALTEAFQQGEDIHTAVAAQIHGVDPKDVTREQRAGAKMVNFGIVYGITPYGLARRLGIGNNEAAEIIDSYKKRFAGITTFLQECIEHARTHGYVETMRKRRRTIAEIDANNPSRRALAERMAINSVVQGSAADLIKVAMVDLHARLSPNAAHLRSGESPDVEGVRMLLQIHDELVFEASEASADAAMSLIIERMERAMDLDVPLVVDATAAKNWYEGK